MTRREAIKAVDRALDHPEVLAEDILIALDDALTLDPETVEVSAILSGKSSVQ